MLDKNKHELILINILKDIYRDPFLASRLGFKGGTALYLFYDLDRFSTDLDFNILADILDDQQIFDKIIDIAKKYGELEYQRIKRNTILIVLSYEKFKQKIKIELSRRDYGDEFELKNFLGISLPVMKKEDMFSHKLVAITDRPQLANRDLYDVHWFLNKHIEINENIIKLRTGKNIKEYLNLLVTFIEKKVVNNKILDGLGEVLNEEQKKEIKNNLKTDLIFLLKAYLKVL